MHTIFGSINFTGRRIFSILVLIYLLLVITSSAVLSSYQRLFDIFMSLLYLLPILGAFGASIYAYKNTSSYKRLWQLMSVGMFLWLAGAITLSVYTITLGSANIPSPSLADAFSIGYVPIIAGVMFSLGRIRRPLDNEKKQFLTSVAMLALAMFIVCFKFVLIPALNQGQNLSSLEKIFTIAYPLVDWFVLVSILFASRRFQSKQIDGWILLLMAAFASAVCADILFYLTGNTMNPISSLLMIVAAIFVSASAIDETKGTLIGMISRPETEGALLDLDDGSLRSLLVPILAILITSGVWLSWLINGQKQETPMIIMGSITIMLLLIYRTHLLISDNAILYAKSMHDNLTGLNNHRYFQEALDKSIGKASKSNKPLSLLIIDVDDFSKINSKYGHSTGDRILKSIANAIANELRESDEACRLNDDGFSVLLPRTNDQLALSLAKHLKTSIDIVLQTSFPNMSIGVSLGLSTYPTLAKEKDELFNTADGALYWCKLNGKNEVLLYNPKIVEALNADERADRVEQLAVTEMVKSLAQAVDARDSYTRMHSKGVSTLATSLAKYVGLDEETIKRIETAGTLHDIGKIGIPDDILNKPGRLSNDEINTIMHHPELSAQIIQSTSLKDIMPAVRSHHERWDGAGYPDGLKSTDIPIEARILAIADTFDAMTTNRPYRKALSVHKAIAEIERCSGTQFDPELAAHFLAMLKNEIIDIDLSDSENLEDDKDTAVNF